MEPFCIEKILLPYDPAELQAWKERDPSVAPPFVLNWKASVVSNGYGYNEWKAEQYFRGQGYYVNNNEYNLLSKTTKYERYNESIISIIGTENIEKFRFGVHKISRQNYYIENPSLFVYNLDQFFFAEVIKDEDTIKKPQIYFMYLADYFLGSKSKLICLSDKIDDMKIETVTIDIPF